ncbi:restriction endonuclease subunit S [Haemophilus parahaemolyticus]|uniref:Restriction endonuclease subunit S n=1 Tax=Haemophilus parahaemolyticus TaxID=735 RepID=A0A369ZCS6_HAEPH|nr:restriction endonuclease subunit S [Haemophilus parahaemolyticus]RDF01867.1 restriction endonuclease subunit S [Haemophilus parahaemolyticus]
MNRYERYKDSGIPWLGEVPEHWDTMSLKYICDVRDGTHDTPQYIYESDNSYPLVTSKDISNGNINFESAKFISEEDYLNISKRSNVNFGDLLMPMIGTVGGSVLVETYRKFTIKNVALFKAGQFCAKWLKYFLDSELSKIQFELEKNGGVQDFVGLTTLRNLIILKLPLKEQTTIAHYLDTKLGEIDALIDKQQTLIEKLAEQRTAVITHAVTKGLNPAAPMKKSGVEWLGDVPAHWDVKRLKFMLSEKLKYGANESAESDDPEQPRYIRITDIDEQGNLKDDTFKSLEFEKAKDYLLNVNDILLARSGATVGKSYLYKENLKNFACYAGYLIRARLEQKKFNANFVNYYFQSTSYWDWIKSVNIQATIQNVSAEKYNDFLLSIPDLQEQNSITDYLDQETAKIDRLCETVNQTIGRLKEYRTVLITQAVTGKIKVTDE